LPTTGKQHHLSLPALDKVDPATLIEDDRFSQGQRSAGSRPGLPAAQSEKLRRGGDERDDSDQDADYEQDRLCCHGARRCISAATAGEHAYVRMHAFGSQKVNKFLSDGVNLLFRFFGQIGVMDPTRIGLFDLAEKRLVWTAQRQSVLAANIANSNTPGFQARDVQSFESLMAGKGSIEPVRTQPAHLPGTVAGGLASVITDPSKTRSLDGNGVSLDQQLTKVADTETTQALVTTIWKKYMGMFSMALGRSS
jgi:flagellar basal-body rod protein FlgB